MGRPKGSTNKKGKKPSKQAAKISIPKIETYEKVKRPYKKTAQVTFNPNIEISDGSHYSRPNITMHDFKLSNMTGYPLLYNSRIFVAKIQKCNKKDGTIETTYLRRESPCDPPVEKPAFGPSNADLRYLWEKPMNPPDDQPNNDPSSLLRCLEKEKNDDPDPEEFYIDIESEDDVYEFIDDDEKFNDLPSTSSEAAEKLKSRMFNGKGRKIFPLTITDRTRLYKM